MSEHEPDQKKQKRKSGVVIGRPGQRRPFTGGAAISLDDSQLEARLQSAIGGTLTKGLKQLLGA